MTRVESHGARRGRERGNSFDDADPGERARQLIRETLGDDFDAIDGVAGQEL